MVKRSLPFRAHRPVLLAAALALPASIARAQPQMPATPGPPRAAPAAPTPSQPAPAAPGPLPAPTVAPVAAHAVPLDDAIHLAFDRNRDVIAARLGVTAAEVERVAAGILPNPQFSYTMSNLSLADGTFNCITSPSPLNPTQPGPAVCSSEGAATNLVHIVGVSWELEVWGKRHLRIEAARLGIEGAHAELADALRTVGYAVTGAYLKLQHAEAALELARQVAEQHAETVRVSRERVKKGALAGNELSKIELEQTKYQAAVLAAEQERSLDERALKELLALPPSASDLVLAPVPAPALEPLDTRQLVDQALANRPDFKAATLAEAHARKTLEVARRVPWPNPDVSVAYVRSENVPAGDNPNTLSLGLGLPLPIFDRNQGDIGRARVAIQSAENQLEKLRLAIAHDVAEAVVRARATRRLLDTYERLELDPYGKQTNMIMRAEDLLRSAQAAYQLGATSLLELLEAQRSYIATRSDYLEALAAYRQALADLAAALGRLGVYNVTEAR